MPETAESGIMIQCDGVKYVVLVGAEELNLCYCEWLFAITSTHNNPLLHREILVSLNIEKININLTSFSHDFIYYLSLKYDINV